MIKYININNESGCKITIFPDNQPHINVNDLSEDDDIIVTCSITDPTKLLLLLECSDALDNLFVNKKELHIPYLMGARFDRLMQKGDSVDLRVIAKLINMCGFSKVFLYDVHSDVSTMLINNSINISNNNLVKIYEKNEAILICPDAGAVKKVNKYLEINKNLIDVVYCNKVRDLSNGKISLKVLEPEKCLGKNCIIIDDLCDGGGTFLAIASQVKPKHLTLMVTHGIFSKGIGVFENVFDEIIVSNSYSEVKNKIVKQINL